MSQFSLGNDPSRAPVEVEPAAFRWPSAEQAAAAASNVGGAGRSAPRELTAADIESPRRRRVWLPAFLFLATCATTFLAGAMHWNPEILLGEGMQRTITLNWQQGLIYMASVVGILLTHEMGHFLQTVRYGVPASFPYFIPVPLLMTGTMGAVIGMEGSRADRKQLFDIGLSGPWAGLIVSLPIICFGILTAKVVVHPAPDTLPLGDPLLFKLLAHYLKPDLGPGVLDKNNPLLMAGWVGMLITGLNMLPISQLDGGHVIYGLFGRRSNLVARTFLICAILFVVFGQHYNWTIMLVLVILLGVDHPPTRDDDVPLGFWRRAIGFVSLGIPVLCFTPVLM